MAQSPFSPLSPAGTVASPLAFADDGSAEMEGHARIEHLFREHNDALVRFLSARLGSYQDAREVAQEAYVRLLNLDRPGGAASFLKALLYKTAANLAIDRLRHQRLVTSHLRASSSSLDLFASPADATAAALEDISVLSQALGELPPPCRSAFLMSRVESLDSSEIATRLGVTDRAVRKYIARALVFLQLRLQSAHTPRSP